jgi:hypothetical protein
MAGGCVSAGGETEIEVEAWIVESLSMLTTLGGTLSLMMFLPRWEAPGVVCAGAGLDCSDWSVVPLTVHVVET